MSQPIDQRRGFAKRIRLRPVVERLEARQLLASDLAHDYNTVSPAWYERIDIDQKEIASIAAGQSATEWFSQFVGPRRYIKGDWIVRLSQEATQSITSLENAVARLNQSDIHFQVVAGLGLPGLVQVRSLSLSEQSVRDTLSANDAVVSFSKNERVSGQILPNDSDFGNMTNLHNVGQFGAINDADIDAPEAWDVTRGSTNVVVGVIDSGVDPTHPDLYLNIWLNQGEIPDALRSSLVDTDGDELITFYDLNASANSTRVRDRNANGYIDAVDLLDDPLWADGRDTDGNGFTDDFFGWNFRNDASEVFAPNNPSDNLGHGTHVAGTIGAIGNNARGVTGINWRSSIMSLKFLDESNQGDLSSAIAAVNYATMMRSQFQTNVRVLNNSWGQPGGFNPLLKNTIDAAGNAGILFVAAAGNGNILGSGVDNDRNPFYPASYESDNIISVAASDATDRLAPFSNFGLRSVDIAAPGVGVRSTLPGGRYGEANGTSMATPHVSGVAALAWAAYSTASVAEVKNSILASSRPLSPFQMILSSGGVLSASDTLTQGVFSPSATMIPIGDVTRPNTSPGLIQVTYLHRDGIDLSSIDQQDIVVQRQWGDRELLPIKLLEKTEFPDRGKVSATYEILQQREFSNSSPLSIPSDEIATIESSISVAGVNARVRTIQIDIDISHSWTGDLIAKLTSPSGKSVTLFNQVGSSGDNFRNTRFEDSADRSIRDGIAPFEGSFRPEESLAIFNDDLIDGIWKLEVIDVFPEDGGSLDSWTIRFVDLPWTPSVMDFGTYGIFSAEGQVFSRTAQGQVAVPIEKRQLGLFRIEIEDPSVIYVSSFNDSDIARSLRNAIIEANAATPEPRTIFLERGTYLLEEPISNDTIGDFFSPENNAYCVSTNDHVAWSNQESGDLDIVGNITIFGDSPEGTVIDARGIDRVFKVHPGATLNLNRIKVTNGVAGRGQSGAGILSAGDLSINRTIVANNNALGTPISPIKGGGVAAWNGNLTIQNSQITGNIANMGGGVFVCGDTNLRVDGTTIDNNFGTGLTNFSSIPITVQNSTFSGNRDGAIYSGSRDGITGGRGTAENPDVSNDGRYIVFESDFGNLVKDDTPFRTHVVLVDRLLGTAERISSDSSGTPGNESSIHPSISGDGINVAFSSFASNLSDASSLPGQKILVKNRQTGAVTRISAGNSNQGFDASYQPALSKSGNVLAYTSNVAQPVQPPDTNSKADIYFFDFQTGLTKRIARFSNEILIEPNDDSSEATISNDGRFIAFVSKATNLTDVDTLGKSNIYVFDTATQDIELVSRTLSGQASNDESRMPSISGDGRYVVYSSKSTNLIDGDENNVEDVFLFDRQTGQTTIVSLGNEGQLGNQLSFTPRISQDGSVVVFSSYASNLHANDFNSTADIFLWDRSQNSLSVLFGGNLNGTADNPVLTADASEVFFQFDGNNFLNKSDPNADRNIFQDIVSYHKPTGRRGAVSYFPSPIIAVQNSSFVKNLGFATVLGNMDVSNSFFAGNLTSYDLGMGALSVGYNLYATDPEYSERFFGEASGALGRDILDPRAIDFVEDLSDDLGFPPVHIQIFGSKGIDAGDPRLEDQQDQHGFLRTFPDIGSVESRLANIGGNVYLDTNKNGIRDANEPGVVDALVFLDRNNDRLRQLQESASKSGPDNSNTLENEAGAFSLNRLSEGYNRFGIIPPENWVPSSRPVTRIVDGSIQSNSGAGHEFSMDRTGRFIVSVHDREVAWRLRGLGLGLLAFEFGGQDAAGTS
jgi:subtilisin family serine protease